MVFRLTLIFVFSVLCGAYSTAQAPTPELLHYRFDESGPTITNYASAPPVGTATATIVGSLTQGSTGQCGGSLIGTGTTSANDYVNTGWATDLNGTSWTISFWTNNVPSTTTTFYILGDLNAGQIRVFTGGVAGAGNWILRGGLTDVIAPGGAAAGPSLTTFVYDMPNNEIRAYVNGVLVNTVAQTTVSIAGPGPFKVGAYASSNCLPAGSFMDEFRLYNRALSLAEIQSLFITETTSSFNVTSCGSYTVPSGDTTYTSSGIYMDTIANVNGCDSIMTIDVTILSPSYDTISATVCDTYSSPSGNYNWTSSGIYSDTLTNAIGCDSVITVNLTVNYSSYDSIVEFACDIYSAPDGAQYTSSGIYDVVIQNINGCDSLIHIELTINSSTSSSITNTSCGSYMAPDGAIYSSSGTYLAVITNAAGCDSTITIDLTIGQIDNTINYSDGVLTANQLGVSYQWIDCGTMQPISGEVSQSFTPLVNGSYAVEVSDNICTDTSTCYNVTDVSVGDLAEWSIAVFPNPVQSELNVSNSKGSNLRLELYDNSGKLIRVVETSEFMYKLNTEELVYGIYNLRISNGQTEHVYKVVRN